MSKDTQRRSAAEWRALVDEWRGSGQSREAFAAERKLVRTTFGWWISALAKRGRETGARKPSRCVEPATFLPVQVIGTGLRGHGVVSPDVSGERVEVVLGNGSVVRVPVGTDAAWIGRIFSALQNGVPC